MARTFEDFKRFDTKPEENNFGDEDENLLNIEEAKDDMSPGV